MRGFELFRRTALFSLPVLLVLYALGCVAQIYLVCLLILSVMKPLTGQCGTTLKLEKYIPADWLCPETGK